VRLKAEGVTRYSALRIQLWLKGHEIPIARLKTDLRSEFERLLKQNFFRHPWEFDASDVDAEKPEKRARYERKLLPVDLTLAAADLKPTDDSLLALGSKVVWGDDSKSDTFDLIVRELAQKSSLPADFWEALLGRMRPYIECVGGILGHPEEAGPSGLSDIRIISSADLRQGRTLFFFCCGRPF